MAARGKPSQFRQRPYSIRTRIKTESIHLSQRAPRCQRPYSIRTRIKTPRPVHRTAGQGGRQRPYSIRTRIKTVADKTGLSFGFCQRPYSIRTRIKTTGGWRDHLLPGSVRDHIPLEQGLRRLYLLPLELLVVRQRPYSIRTRIKTKS